MTDRVHLIGFDKVETEWGPKTIFYTDTEIMRVQPTPRRAFQGWRYLKEDAAPKDIAPYTIGDELPPPEMEKELVELGLL